MNPAAIILDLEAEKARIDKAIAALRDLQLLGYGASPAGPPPRGKSKGVAGWKHRRRCPKCEQLTSTDPCQHCGAEIAPAGARK